MPIKKIRFDYFRPTLLSKPEILVKLTPYFELLKKIDPEKREIEHSNATSIRINYITNHKNYKITTGGILQYSLWEVRFTRPRYDIPGIFNNKTNETAPAQLDDDEYVADETTLLYDENKDIIIIQRNQTGAPPSAIKRMLNSMIEKEEEYIDLQPLIKLDSFEKVLNNEYYSAINVRLTNTNDQAFIEDIKNNEPVKQIVAAANEFSVPQEYQMQAEFSFKIAERNTKKSFKTEKFKKFLKILFPLIKNDKIDKLIVKGRLDEQSSFEEVDLIKDVIRDWISFDVTEKSRYIASTVIFDKIAYAYSQCREKY